MVQVAGAYGSVRSLKRSLFRTGLLTIGIVVLLSIFYASCVERVDTDEFGVMQKKFGFQVGIVNRAFEPGLYFVGPGTTIHTFPREIHILEASNDRQQSLDEAARRGT